MRTITLTETVEAVEWAVRQQGEGYLYPVAPGTGTCHYRWDTNDVAYEVATQDQLGKPACLVGLALDHMGLLDLLVPQTEHEDGLPDWFSNEEPVCVLFDIAAAYDAQFDSDAQAFLTEAQNAQDGQCTWGISLRRARNVVGLPLVSPSNREVGHDVPVPAPVAG